MQIDILEFLTPVQIMMLFSMYLAIKGSRSFVNGEFELGAVYFVLTDAINIIVGLYFNLFFSLAQAGLLYFVALKFDIINNKKDRIFFTNVLLCSFVLVYFLGAVDINTLKFHTDGYLDIIATITAIYGSYMMSKDKTMQMAIAWIIADIGFLWIAYQNKIVGLAIMAMFFIYHGFLRVKKELALNRKRFEKEKT
jgi:hypothetical protein